MRRARRLGVLAALAAAVGGPAAPAETGAQACAPGTTQVLFSPWDDTEAAILRTLRAARREILVQAFVLTSRALAGALIEAHARGVSVRVLADAEQAARVESSQLPALAAAGIPVALETRYAAAHNKILVVDPDAADGAVVTGSYNFTFAARARNAENVVILRGDPAVLRAYRDNWRRHRREAQPLEAAGGQAE